MTNLSSAARKAFSTQRSAARARGIGWELTLAEWWEIWARSGVWARRGKGSDSYVMARDNDLGPYTRTNVRICKMADNLRQSMGTRRKRLEIERGLRRGGVCVVTI